jgi:mRNA interferase RelE/StbE
MELVLSKSAIKFLAKIPPKDSKKIQTKILYLLDLAEKSDSIVSQELDIKQLKGIWDGFSRLRVGKIRVIFLIDLEQDELFIYAIDFRGDIY